MSELQVKYNSLDTFGQKEVIDFIDFLINKRQRSLHTDKSNFQKKLLQVSVWSEEDVEFMEKQHSHK